MPRKSSLRPEQRKVGSKTGAHSTRTAAADVHKTTIDYTRASLGVMKADGGSLSYPCERGKACRHRRLLIDRRPAPRRLPCFDPASPRQHNRFACWPTTEWSRPGLGLGRGRRAEGGQPAAQAGVAGGVAVVVDQLAQQDRRAQVRAGGQAPLDVGQLGGRQLAWLGGQVLPERPTLADYDAAARRWALEVVAKRRHRTTERIVGEAWATERVFLVPLARRLVARAEGLETLPAGVLAVAAARPRLALVGETVEVRPLAVYAELAR
jgi:hypothetical protein